MNVSILILTYNEAANLPACLSAVAWCDDVLVIDSGSTDDTVAIADQLNIRVIQRPFDTFAAQRNFGLDNGELKHEWVLHLDADEILTNDFRKALEALTPPPEIDAYLIPSKTMLFGRWLKHAGMWPTYQVRLGRRDRLRFKQDGHGQREDLPSDRIATFSEPYLHFSFSHGMVRWLQKHISYAQDEANAILAQTEMHVFAISGTNRTSSTLRRRRLKSLANRLPAFTRPIFRFFYIYFLRLGFLDGRPGLAYAIMLAVYEGMIAIFLYEDQLRRGGSEKRAQIRARHLSGEAAND